MTTHARQQIREAVASAVTGLTTTGTKVYQSRLHALRDSNIPCLLVNTDEEDVQPSLGIIERSLHVRVAGVAKASANLDDTLDQMALEVETALASGVTVGGKSRHVTLTGISVEMTDELEKPAGIIGMDYRITYHTAPGAPGVLI
ncbi:MAG: hypothetical protein K8H84_10985 [Sulfuricella denitrificans]|nr:hypothetical protein [Sulfuricella denitrificans]